jgi:hypothetical protein
VAAAGAIVVSFLVSLIAGAGFPDILLRPLAFGALFFLLIWLAGKLVARFLPELTQGNSGKDSPAGGVDITVGDEDNTSGVNFAENARTGLDQIKDSEYNARLEEGPFDSIDGFSSDKMDGFSSTGIGTQDATFSLEGNTGNNPVADMTKAADMAKAVQTLLKSEE